MNIYRNSKGIVFMGIGHIPVKMFVLVELNKLDENVKRNEGLHEFMPKKYPTCPSLIEIRKTVKLNESVAHVWIYNCEYLGPDCTVVRAIFGEDE